MRQAPDNNSCDFEQMFGETFLKEMKTFAQNINEYKDYNNAHTIRFSKIVEFLSYSLMNYIVHGLHLWYEIQILKDMCRTPIPHPDQAQVCTVACTRHEKDGESTVFRLWSYLLASLNMLERLNTYSIVLNVSCEYCV